MAATGTAQCAPTKRAFRACLQAVGTKCSPGVSSEKRKGQVSPALFSYMLLILALNKQALDLRLFVAAVTHPVSSVDELAYIQSGLAIAQF
jgi:hypothetical protein